MRRPTKKGITKTARTWAFYYIVNRGYDLQVIGTFDCKHPERTNMYKELKKKWRSGEQVTGIGYTTVINDPFFVWPQSKLA